MSENEQGTTGGTGGSGAAVGLMDRAGTPSPAAPPTPESPGRSRSALIVVGVVAVVAMIIAGGVALASGGHGSSSAPRVAEPTTVYSVTTVHELGMQDAAFLQAVQSLRPGVSDADLVVSGRAFCTSVAIDGGNTHTATAQALAANDSNPGQTISDDALLQFDGAAVSTFCPQYNLAALTFS